MPRMGKLRHWQAPQPQDEPLSPLSHPGISQCREDCENAQVCAFYSPVSLNKRCWSSREGQEMVAASLVLCCCLGHGSWGENSTEQAGL